MSVGAGTRLGLANPIARRFGKYSLVCAVNVVLGVAVLSFAFGVLGWPARSANLLGTALVTLPSYLLNRAWVWGRSGRSHLLHEVLPFWAMAFLGFFLSTWTATLAERAAADVTSARPVQTAIVVGAVLATFVALWVGRFAVLELVLFADRGAREPNDPGVGRCSPSKG